MKKLLIVLVGLSSCTVQKETIHYTAYKCKCSYQDGFGFDRHKQVCDTGSVVVRSSDIIKRSPLAVKVDDGNCTYVYLIK